MPVYKSCPYCGAKLHQWKVQCPECGHRRRTKGRLTFKATDAQSRKDKRNPETTRRALETIDESVRRKQSDRACKKRQRALETDEESVLRKGSERA